MAATEFVLGQTHVSSVAVIEQRPHFAEDPYSQFGSFRKWEPPPVVRLTMDLPMVRGDVRVEMPASKFEELRAMMGVVGYEVVIRPIGMAASQ